MFDVTADQQLLQETTRRFLDAESTPAQLRDLAGTKAGFEPGYWKQGAHLGWTSLVVPEEAGGGSISGNGAQDLSLIAYEFGAHAAPGPLIPVNVVAAAIGRWGTDSQRQEILPPLLAGDATAAWVTDDVTAAADGDGFVLNGAVQPVEAGYEAEHFLVSARDGDRTLQFLVARDTPGLTVSPMQGLDMTRRFARVELEAVRLSPDEQIGDVGRSADAVDWLSDLAVVIQLAEMVGCMQWAFDTTLEWAFNRYSFGRPLASYQEIKHRFADMKMWLEASYAIAHAATRAVDADAPDRRELVSAGKVYVGRNGPELMQDCVQIHGGIGVTFDHDLHMFLRRVTSDIPTYGSPVDHAIRIGEMLQDSGTD